MHNTTNDKRHQGAVHTPMASKTTDPVADKRDAALGEALKALFCPIKNGTRQHGKTKRLTVPQFLHLIHRLLIIVTVVWYMITSIQSSVASLQVLDGVHNEPMEFEAYDTNNILRWMGTASIRQSPFVMQVLQNNTTPRNYTIYLETNGVVSTTGCSGPLSNKRLYTNAFLRLAVGGYHRDCAYNITELLTYDLVVPLVDCSFPPLVEGLDTNARAFFLYRNKLNVDDLYIQATRFSMQDYKVIETNDYGPFGLTNHQFIKDMSHPTVYKTVFSGSLGYPFEPVRSYVFTIPTRNDQGWWVMTKIPPDAATAPKEVITSCRTGFYVGSDGEQANIKEQYWSIDNDPITALTKWNWKGAPMVKDSWAWVHLIHVWFAVDSFGSLTLLLLVMYSNYQKGRVWIGDAFTSISSSLLIRGGLILVSWVINGFWSLMEYCLHDAHTLAKTQDIFFHPEIMRADLMTLFLALTTIVSYILRARISPAFAVPIFEIVFNARIPIAKAFPSIAATMTDFAMADWNLSILGVSESVALSSPLRLWTAHILPAKDLKFIFSCLLPIFFAQISVIVYIIARKIYHHYFKPHIYKQDSKATTGIHVAAGDDATMVRYKRNLTLFEIATGAELQTKFGVVADFETYLFIKGMKYASADGIYSNGFVIANENNLLATNDWFPIVFQNSLVSDYEISTSIKWMSHHIPMTLDTLTRASAEKKHVQLKSSLARSRAEFRDRFKHDTELFRTLQRPSSSSGIPLSPVTYKSSTAVTSVVSPLILGEDLVRTERLTQCCKRVRIWKRQTTNPLLQYKYQRSHGPAIGTTTTTIPNKGGPTLATDHRMHFSLLMTMIVDLYEQKMTAEVGAATVLLPIGNGIHESLPEFVVKYLTTRAPSRRLAVEQIHSMVALLVQPSTHARVRTFAALCGLDDAYNPPEKLRAFLHMLESIHRLKMTTSHTSPSTVLKAEDASSLGEIVFHNVGVPLGVALRVIAELFEDEFYWNFRFWHSHFQELRLHYTWPASARLELEENVVNLSTVGRSIAINATKKIDTDAFLELLLNTWTERAKALCELLEQATNDEERKGTASLDHKQAVQDARGHIAPLTPAERQLFGELVNEFWNAEVPWATNPTIQRRVSAACESTRSIEEIASLYKKHITELDDTQKAWLWPQWPWDVEWEWGLLVVRKPDDTLA